MTFSSEITEITDLNSLAKIANHWEALASLEHHSVFLSWPWISAWMAALPDDVKLYLVCLHKDAVLVGMALLTEQKLQRHYFIKSKAFALHECLLPQCNFMIEHNGFLTKSHDPELSNVLIRSINDYFDWDEIYLSGFTDNNLLANSSLIHALLCRPRVLKQSESRYLDIGQTKRESGNFMDSLAKKTRYKLRGYLKAIASHGDVSVQLPRSLAQAHDFFSELKVFHQKHWQEKGQSGSFANPAWETFHRSLIDKMFALGGIQLCKVLCGEKTIGVIYSLVKDRRVSMIQSGYNYDAFGLYHPGYISLFHVIEHNFTQENLIFDFLAGDTQYKKSLSNACAPMYWGLLQRKRMKFTFENCIRKLRRKLLKIDDSVSF